LFTSAGEIIIWHDLDAVISIYGSDDIVPSGGEGLEFLIVSARFSEMRDV
jgi:hypothetical protein